MALDEKARRALRELMDLAGIKKDAPPHPHGGGRPRNLELWGDCPNCGKHFKKKIREPRQYTDGQPRMQEFCSKSCANRSRGRNGCLDTHGYMILPAGKRGAYRPPQHRAVMEELIGRKLLPGETVHHKNGVRSDNRPENLELWSSRHGKGQRVGDRIRDAKTFLAEHRETSVTLFAGVNLTPYCLKQHIHVLL